MQSNRKSLFSLASAVALTLLAAATPQVHAQLQGRLVSWGYDGLGQVSNTPAGNNFIAVAAGTIHSVALRSDGSLVSWGEDVAGVVSKTPAGTGFITVAAGGRTSTALRSDGSLVSWGDDYYDQVSNTPTGTGFRAVSVGSLSSTAIRADGSLVSWGYDDNGVLSGTPSGTDFRAVSVGWDQCVAIRSDGSLVSWGNDDYGQVSHTPAGTGFFSVVSGQNHQIALRSDGSLVSWGDDSYRQVSHTPAGSGFIAVAAGNFHGVALRADGSLVSWGNDDYGLVSHTPAGTGFFAAAGGRYGSVAINPNRPPTANAGLDQNLEATGPTTPVTLDGSGSSDPDGDSLAYEWKDANGHFLSSTAILPLNLAKGSYTFTLTVSDPIGASSTDMVTVTILDTNPPIITLNGADPMTVEAGSVFTDPGATANDLVEGSVAVFISGSVNTTVPGTYTLTYTAKDAAGNLATKTRTVKVVDTTPPTISGVSVSPSVLKPNNHQMATVKVNYSVADAGDPNPTCWLTATSNEPDNGLGDGDVPNDIQVVDAHTIKLRAERSGKGAGRIYTITIHCQDASGNLATKTVTVTVSK